jgi:hypothetical protein
MSSSKVSFTRKEGDSEILVVLNMATTTTSATLTGLSAGGASRLSTAHKKLIRHSFYWKCRMSLFFG